jgi:hypothetical protein
MIDRNQAKWRYDTVWISSTQQNMNGYILFKNLDADSSHRMSINAVVELMIEVERCGGIKEARKRLMYSVPEEPLSQVCNCVFTPSNFRVSSGCGTNCKYPSDPYLDGK